MKKILISGDIFEEDLSCIGGSTQMKVKTLPFMDQIDIDSLCVEAADADLLIFRLTGQNPLTFIENCKRKNKWATFEKIACPKVVWSQDSHHMHPHETRAEPYFTRFYVAHGNYIDKFSSRAVWLPCCYTGSSLQAFLRLAKIELPKDRELISVYSAYFGSKRNPILYEISKILQKQKVRYLFGRIHGNQYINATPYGDLLYGLKSSSISLNVPFLDDFNIRNFESIAMNCSLLAIETSEHKKVDLDYSHTFFFKSDLSNFVDALHDALEDISEKKDVWRCIPGKHMLIDRYISIINNELDTDFFIKIDNIDCCTKIEVNTDAKLHTHEKNIVYTAEFLLAHSLISLLLDDHLDRALQQMKQAQKQGVDVEKTAHDILSIMRSHSKHHNNKIYKGLIAIFSICGLSHAADSIFESVTARIRQNSIPEGIHFYIKKAQAMASVKNFQLHKDVFFASLNGLGILNFKNSVISGEDFFLQKILSGKHEPTILDIGANIGTYATAVRKISNNASVYAFEPNPFAFSTLKKQAKIHGFFAFPLGMSNEEKEAVLFDRRDEQGSAHASLYSRVITDIHKQEIENISVKLTTVDAFIKTTGLASIDLVKIDTEGHELSVLCGASESIRKKIIKAFQIEFNEMNIIANSSFSMLKKLLPNYSWYRLLPDGMVALDDEPIVLQEIYAFQNLAAILNA
ncbi:MAG: FkbM family methyltransferase [Desulfovibrio sp.]|jgi:FkbM family methyltransferase|nr:FkbM family methyltransferase [Desulfovibrio sp.]